MMWQFIVESPLVKEIVDQAKCETQRECLVRVLARRFGPIHSEVAEKLQSVSDLEELDALFDHAIECPSWSAFREKLKA